MFLEAATTGGKNQKYVPQPFSDELAHPRRFALKPAFVTTLLKKESYLVEEEISPLLAEEEFAYPLVEEEITPPQTFLINKLKQYKNISLDETITMLNIEKNSQKISSSWLNF